MGSVYKVPLSKNGACAVGGSALTASFSAATVRSAHAEWVRAFPVGVSIFKRTKKRKNLQKISFRLD